ncbi:AtpZ/AtpI family protein [Methylohalobius crimeensis]|uniref:AtpZ/AtpI family protein n=1 Tax=Methylohalobius crimeensis TaxID=244365 RepID=UPI0003B3AF77|nr:AtpZ/AtpI family protein [Methylohalobius crimeensis]
MIAPRHRDWLVAVRRQVRDFRRSSDEERTLLAQLAYLGTAGLVLVLPMVAGAYLGNWIDSKLPGYSIQWTLSLIFLGLVLGLVNLWLLFKGE